MGICTMAMEEKLQASAAHSARMGVGRRKGSTQYSLLSFALACGKKVISCLVGLVGWLVQVFLLLLHIFSSSSIFLLFKFHLDYLRDRLFHRQIE